MRTGLSILLIGAIALLGGCSADDTTPADGGATTELSAEQLGEMGARIADDPDRTDQILAERGLDRATYETAIRGVTEDLEKSERYAEAFEKARG